MPSIYIIMPRHIIRCFRQMIASAWKWARQRNLLRVNPMHKEEEAKLILSEVFAVNDETGAETTMSGTIEAEDNTRVGVVLASHA